MRKYLTLFYITSIFLLCAFAIPKISEENLPTVDVITVKKELITESVICSGVIEAADSKKVVCDVPVYPLYINVKEGDRVKKGDLLVQIDKEQTACVMMTQSSALNSGDAVTPSSIPNAVYAPVSGVVTALNAREGKIASPASPLMTISETENMQITAQVSENQISDIKTGQDVIITGAGFEGREYKGTVEKIAAAAKQTSTGLISQTTVGVTARIVNPDENLKQGFTSKAEILISDNQEKFLVPYEAVEQDENEREFVFVYSNGSAVKRYIITGNEYEEGFEVSEGLSDNDVVIINPHVVKKDNGFVKLGKEAVI